MPRDVEGIATDITKHKNSARWEHSFFLTKGNKITGNFMIKFFYLFFIFMEIISLVTYKTAHNITYLEFK